MYPLLPARCHLRALAGPAHATRTVLSMLARSGAVCALLAIPLSALPSIVAPALGTGSGAAPTATYAGTDLGNVWASRDAGATWQEADAGLPRTARGTAYALAVAPGRPDTVYLGSGLGVFRTEDGGRSWRDTGVGGIPNIFPVLSLAVDPRDPHRVYAAAQALLRTLDGGARWTSIAAPGAPEVVALDPRHPTTVLAGGTKGIARSADGGLPESRCACPA